MRKEVTVPEEIKELLQEYQEGKITRREFILRAVAITGSLAAANTLLEPFLATPLYAAQVDPKDPTLASEMVQFPGPASTVFGYVSRPIVTSEKEHLSQLSVGC